MATTLARKPRKTTKRKTTTTRRRVTRTYEGGAKSKPKTRATKSSTRAARPAKPKTKRKGRVTLTSKQKDDLSKHMKEGWRISKERKLKRGTPEFSKFWSKWFKDRPVKISYDKVTTH